MQLLSPTRLMRTPGLPPCATAPSLVSISPLHAFLPSSKGPQCKHTQLLSAAFCLRQVVIRRMTRI